MKATLEFNLPEEQAEHYCAIKGIEQEQDSIDLLNLVRVEQYTKNEKREENEWLTGSCDIITEDLTSLFFHGFFPPCLFLLPLAV